MHKFACYFNIKRINWRRFWETISDLPFLPSGTSVDGANATFFSCSGTPIGCGPSHIVFEISKRWRWGKAVKKNKNKCDIHLKFVLSDEKSMIENNKCYSCCLLRLSLSLLRRMKSPTARASSFSEESFSCKEIFMDSTKRKMVKLIQIVILTKENY